MFQSSKNEIQSAACPSTQYWLPQCLDLEGCPYVNEYNFEWKKYLLNKNSDEIKSSVTSQERFIFYTPKIVKCIFNVCKMLDQPPEVRYLAVDVVDRFLVEHFFKVGETFSNLEDKNLINWETIMERILSQSLLRILTCIQLSMKFCWSSNVISAQGIQEIIKNFGVGEQYSKKSIIKSEARIPNKTPLLYLEMFFDNFQKNEYIHAKLPLHSFFTTCIHVLDIAFIYHQRIYANFIHLLKNSCGETSIEDGHMVTLKADFVVLAASVVFASSVLKDPSSETSKILLGILCAIGECEISHIQSLGKQLLNIILDN